jgi:septal ring factor EnvC (AmiA/AmiB activator)
LLTTCEDLLTESATLASLVVRTPATESRRRARLATLACAALLLASLSVAPAEATSVGALRERVSSAREEADSLVSQLQTAQGEIAAAEAEAAVASAREQKLTRLLVTGRERAARLADEVRQTQRQLEAEKKRLRRARRVLATRLVVIYESGSPDTASVILTSNDIEDLAARTEYLARIQQSDADLALRVAQVRRSIAGSLARAAGLKERAKAYDARLASAREEIVSVRGNAEAAAAHLDGVVAARSASLTTLKAKIGNWVSDIQAAEEASRAEAEGTVERWLGGPYAIPTYIVLCESGGNYGAVNPSSGAGGAYQILPSTWELYGGQGAPQDAPKQEQDRIAAEIWADSGSSAWVCG